MSTTTSASPIDGHASPVGAAGKSRRAIASFVLGILSVIAFLIPILGVILGIVAVILGLTSRSDCSRAGRPTPWQATAGLVLGSLGIIASLALFVAALASA